VRAARACGPFGFGLLAAGAVSCGDMERRGRGRSRRHGKVQRSYIFALRGKFIEVKNRSVYPPQKNNEKGEIHEDHGFISYDRNRKKLVLRQFHVEGFVNQYVMTSASPDGRVIVFESENIENIASGWRAKETYTFIGNDQLVERFELAEPGKDFSVYSENKLKRE
jgi:hypothetical protein